MGLLDEIEQQSPSKSLCPVGAAMLTMTPDMSADLMKAMGMDPKRIPGAAITRALRAHDIVVDEDTLRKHRKGACRCRTSTSR